MLIQAKIYFMKNFKRLFIYYCCNCLKENTYEIGAKILNLGLLNNSNFNFTFLEINKTTY